MVALAGVGPEARVAAAPFPLPSTGAEGVTPVAPAWPVLVTVSVTATVWPVLTVPGEAAMVAESEACAWMATAAGDAGVTARVAPELASIPVALAWTESVPGAVAA
jgi:hypothetical protein